MYQWSFTSIMLTRPPACVHYTHMRVHIHNYTDMILCATVQPVICDHLSWATTFAGLEGLKTGLLCNLLEKGRSQYHVKLNVARYIAQWRHPFKLNLMRKNWYPLTTKQSKRVLTRDFCYKCAATVYECVRTHVSTYTNTTTTADNAAVL